MGEAPPVFSPARSLAQEREALKLKQRQKDTADAVDKMREKLSSLGIVRPSTSPQLRLFD